VVEAVFERFAGVLHLHLGGQLIRTTAEHPFYAAGKGWTAAFELQPGDGVLTADGTWVKVEEVFDTGEWEPVYNLRVADHHTYFVGEQEWGWTAWAHNIYLQPVEVNGTGTFVLRIQKDAKTPSKESYVSKDWNSSVEKQGDALPFAGSNAFQKALTAAASVNKIATPFTKALDGHFTEAILRGLFTKYGQGYKGDFSNIDRGNEDETEKTTGRDALFDALVYPPSNGTTRGGRDPISFSQAKAAFDAINKGAGLTGDDRWVVPEPPSVAAVEALKPTNQQGGYSIPEPYKADPDAITAAKNEPHRRAAIYERSLAYQIHRGVGQFASTGGIVIWWGDFIGSNGSGDAISVNPTTGQVTLWDSKAYANGSPNIESDTFTVKRQRDIAVAHARRMINDFAWKAEDLVTGGLRDKAVASLADATRNYKLITVRYTPVGGANAFTPLKLNETKY
jgi:hypothetical protein